MSADDEVLRHFDEDASRFDAVYEDEAGPLRRFIDRVWRGVVRHRLELALSRLQPLQDRSVLDVGCGSGRYGIALAKRGARRIVGVDFAPAMIDLAQRLAAEAGVSDRCEFLVGAFPEAAPPTRFDYCLAMGYFDYVSDPERHVAAMCERTSALILMSFPKAFEWRVPFRRLRFLLLRCPLHLYTARRVRRILARAGVKDYDWVDLGRDYVVIARPDPARARPARSAGKVDPRRGSS